MIRTYGGLVGGGGERVWRARRRRKENGVDQLFIPGAGYGKIGKKNLRSGRTFVR